jgi:uncharacterized protein YecT (DUF1311 family)
VEPDRRGGVHQPVRKTNWTAIALIGALVLLVLIIAYFATRGNSDQDKLTGNDLVQTEQPAKAPSPEKLCASKATFDLIKRDLFKRAAQLRGSDQAAFDQMSGFAVLRMENPVMESEDSSTGAVNCSGSMSLDLPPGIAVVGGRRTLSSDVDYTVQPAADGSGNVVLLRNADPIVTPLATISRVSQAPSQSTEANENGVASVPPVEQAQPASPPATGSTPSFSCSSARTTGEKAICEDPGLAALDRNMASQYQRAFSAAEPQERELLRQTARRFYAYRDRCPDRKCIADAYVGRMREIRDIVEGRWQPPR